MVAKDPFTFSSLSSDELEVLCESQSPKSSTYTDTLALYQTIIFTKPI